MKGLQFVKNISLVVSFEVSLSFYRTLVFQNLFFSKMVISTCFHFVKNHIHGNHVTHFSFFFVFLWWEITLEKLHDKKFETSCRFFHFVASCRLWQVVVLLLRVCFCIIKTWMFAWKQLVKAANDLLIKLLKWLFSKRKNQFDFVQDSFQDFEKILLCHLKSIAARRTPIIC